MSEMALTAEHLIVIGRGKLIADTSMTEFIERASTGRVKVRSPQAARLGQLLAGPDVTVGNIEEGTLLVSGLISDQIGQIASDNGITLFELASQQASLEEAFMELTKESVEYHATVPVAARAAGVEDAVPAPDAAEQKIEA
jgi:ABC-2 type transport system ATP-binding protein